MNSKLSHYQKTKLLQGFIWLGATTTAVLFWNGSLFLWALLTGWLFSGIGLGIAYHRYSAHKTFEPKNRLIKLFLLLIGTLVTHGSAVAWTITHRYHHKFADTPRDPTRTDCGLWSNIKGFFYHFESPEVPNSQVMVIDLIRDKDVMFFHRHYFAIIFSYVALLASFDPVLVGYFYCIPVCFVLISSGWVTTLAHLPATMKLFGYRNYDTPDKSYNSHFWQWFSMGDGYHNNHHACPWLWDMAVAKYEFDLCGQIVKLIGFPNTRPALPINSKEKNNEITRA